MMSQALLSLIGVAYFNVDIGVRDTLRTGRAGRGDYYIILHYTILYSILYMFYHIVLDIKAYYIKSKYSMLYPIVPYPRRTWGGGARGPSREEDPRPGRQPDAVREVLLDEVLLSMSLSIYLSIYLSINIYIYI